MLATLATVGRIALATRRHNLALDAYWRFGASITSRASVAEFDPGAWAELVGPLDRCGSQPVLACAFAATEAAAVDDLREQLTTGDAAWPCELCAGPGAVVMFEAAVLYEGMPRTARRVVSRGAVLCGICCACSAPVTQ